MEQLDSLKQSSDLQLSIKNYPLIIGGKKVSTQNAYFHMDANEFLKSPRDISDAIEKLNNIEDSFINKLEYLIKECLIQYIHSYWFLADKKLTINAATSAGEAYEELKRTTIEQRIKTLIELGNEICSDYERWRKISEQDFHNKTTFDYELKYVKSIFNETHLRRKARRLEDRTFDGDIITAIQYRAPFGAFSVNTPPNTGFTMGTNVFVDLFLAGVSAVYKPSKTAAATTNELLTYFNDFLMAKNYPPGVINLICGDAEDVIQAIMNHEAIKGLIHIGGIEGGRAIQQEYQDAGKPVFLEMNGSDLSVFLDDLSEEQFSADIKRAFEERVFGAAGQFCVGPKRFLVPSVYKELAIEIAKEVVENSRVGLMSDDNTTLIPVSDSVTILKQMRDLSFAEETEIIIPSRKVNYLDKDDEQGTFITASIVVLNQPQNNSIFMRQEVFGPVIQIGILKDLAIVPQILDNSLYNMKMSVYSGHQRSINYLLETCKTGTLMINVPHLDAYGGVVSGGRGDSCEHSKRGAREFSIDATKPVHPRLVVVPKNQMSTLNTPEENDDDRYRKEGIVKLKIKKTALDINKGYQTDNRVQSYVATQEKLIVPKYPLFCEIIRQICEKINVKNDWLKIFEPGIGPAMFTRYLFTNHFLNNFKKIKIEGADISQGMLLYSSDLVNKLYEQNGEGTAIQVNFTAGVNCVSQFSPFYQTLIAEETKFDVIVASQFEHYCPNNFQSELGFRYRNNGIQFSIKKEFRKLCYELLERGGVYFTIDDRLGESLEEHEEISYSWDCFVVDQTLNPDVLAQIVRLNPSLANKLRKKYNSQIDRIQLVNQAKVTRQHRRYVCCEEIEPLSQTIKDLEEIFGKDNVGYMMHPSINTHPNFYLAWAYKK